MYSRMRIHEKRPLPAFPVKAYMGRIVRKRGVLGECLDFEAVGKYAGGRNTCEIPGEQRCTSAGRHELATTGRGGWVRYPAPDNRREILDADIWKDL